MLKEKNTKEKIILTSGKSLEIQRQYKVWIYFDQQEVLTKKLGIKAVPAIVEQDKLRLKITEVASSNAINGSSTSNTTQDSKATRNTINTKAETKVKQ